MHTYTDLYLAHPLETWTPFDIVVNSAYALLTYKPTNVVNSPFIRYSGTSTYIGESLITSFDSDRTSTSVTWNSSDSLPFYVMPLVYETVKQYATDLSSTILVLTRNSTRNHPYMVIIIVKLLILHLHLNFETCLCVNIRTMRPNVIAVGCGVIGLRFHSAKI